MKIPRSRKYLHVYSALPYICLFLLWQPGALASRLTSLYDYFDTDTTTANVFCKINDNELDCAVHIGREIPRNCGSNVSSGVYDFCEGFPCPIFLSCLYVNNEALVMTAFQHQEKGTKPPGVDGLSYRFNINNNWKPRNPLNMSEPVEMKITTSMLTKEGFTSLRLGKEPPKKLGRKNKETKNYIGISGGGWRALSGHMGAFRALSNNNALSNVDMLSSVSGGTWFLTKLAFDNDFARLVLDNKTPIADVVFKWFESGYFPIIRNVNHAREINPDAAVKSFVTTMISQAPGPVKTALGNAVVAADHFNFSWQAMVERSVLGQHVANQTFTDAPLATETRAKFGEECTLAFNWNQLHHWEDEDTLWFLKTVPGEHAQHQMGKMPSEKKQTKRKRRNRKHRNKNQRKTEHVQYPVYTSALYKQLRDGQHEVEVKAQGKAMSELFQVCRKPKDGTFTEIDFSSGIEFNATTILIALVTTFAVVYVVKAMVLEFSWILPWILPSVVVGTLVSPTRFYHAVSAVTAVLLCGVLYIKLIQITKVLECAGFIGLIVVACFLVNYLTSQPKKIELTHSVVVPPTCAVVTAALLGGVPAAIISGCTFFVFLLLFHIIKVSTRVLDSLLVFLSAMYTMAAVALLCGSVATGVYFVFVLFFLLFLLPILTPGLAFRLDGKQKLYPFFTAFALLGLALMYKIKLTTAIVVPRGVAAAAVLGAVMGHSEGLPAATRSVMGHSKGIAMCVASLTFVSVLEFAIRTGPNVFQIARATAEESTIITEECGAFNFDFGGLTIGQVAAASSAAVGGGAVRTWVHNVIELARQHCSDVGYCPALKYFVQQLNDEPIVEDELLKVAGCKDEHSSVTATRWRNFFQGMAIEMNMVSSDGEKKAGHMTIDAGYNDNSGLAPILADYLASGSDHGQILVLVINQLGDHQMETYFQYSPGGWGMICEDETTSAKLGDAFKKMDKIHKHSFQTVGGEYVPQKDEYTCAIRLPRAVFFEGEPPQHNRFEDRRIPSHITYGYKENVVIAQNDDFYTLPKDKPKQIDLLFLIANADVKTGSLPVAGSESYVGTAVAMEFAMQELSEKFPMFFGEEGAKTSNQSENDDDFFHL